MYIFLFLDLKKYNSLYYDEHFYNIQKNNTNTITKR